MTVALWLFNATHQETILHSAISVLYDKAIIVVCGFEVFDLPCLCVELQAANSNPNGCREGNIQPFDQNEGRVKYCHNGKPRFVCSHGWSNEDATVVCRQMGLPTQGTYIHVHVKVKLYSRLILDRCLILGTITFS